MLLLTVIAAKTWDIDESEERVGTSACSAENTEGWDWSTGTRSSSAAYDAASRFL